MPDSNPYKALGRGFLMVDELPEGALPRYERDVSIKSYTIGSTRKGVPLIEPYQPTEELRGYMAQWVEK